MTSKDDELLEKLAAGLRPADLDAEARARMWSKVGRLVASPAPAGTETFRADAGDWIELGPLVKCRRLRVDSAGGSQTVLVRASSGACLPGHRHSKEEMFMVLEGECHIGAHHLRAGDAHFADAGSWHDDITTRTGVLVLIRGEYPAPAGPT
jgi:anti-sigma factor ChrR (cupin superfamily)